MTDKTTPAEPDGGFVAWFDANGHSYAVFHASDDPGTDRWFNADQHDSADFDGPLKWAEVLAAMAGFDGPHKLVRAA